MYGKNKRTAMIILLLFLLAVAQAEVRYEVMPDHVLIIEKDKRKNTHIGLFIHGKKEDEYILTAEGHMGSMITFMDTIFVKGIPYIVTAFDYGYPYYAYMRCSMRMRSELFYFKIEDNKLKPVKMYLLRHRERDVAVVGKYVRDEDFSFMCDHHHHRMQIFDRLLGGDVTHRETLTIPYTHELKKRSPKILKH